jgi:hypothetical protein
MDTFIYFKQLKVSVSIQHSFKDIHSKQFQSQILR